MQDALITSLSSLFDTGLKVTGPIGQLHLIREKIGKRGYQEFDKKDILDELGRLQHVAGELHKEMITIHDLLTEKNQ